MNLAYHDARNTSLIAANHGGSALLWSGTHLRYHSALAGIGVYVVDCLTYALICSKTKLY